jgi:hypothetical protein
VGVPTWCVALIGMASALNTFSGNAENTSICGDIHAILILEFICYFKILPKRGNVLAFRCICFLLFLKCIFDIFLKMLKNSNTNFTSTSSHATCVQSPCMKNIFVV